MPAPCAVRARSRRPGRGLWSGIARPPAPDSRNRPRPAPVVQQSTSTLSQHPSENPIHPIASARRVFAAPLVSPDPPDWVDSGGGLPRLFCEEVLPLFRVISDNL